MEQYLTSLNGKQVDISFGGSSVVRGRITGLKEGILFLEDEEERTLYVVIDKITVVREVKEHLSRPGFVI
jgi:hypothetical protein